MLGEMKQLDIDVSPPAILDFNEGNSMTRKDMQRIIPRHASGSWHYIFETFMMIFIDREAREIMYLVASVRLSFGPSVRPSVNALTAECTW